MSRNQLENATSPYLLQHAANPVHWREWGSAALLEAQTQGKPILLSIGYSACHWCHVMAHESFEDDATAAVMNALFVNIKVDREERPDIDHIYMTALHAQGQLGGWPLTMFLTPQGAPFWGGTYFPNRARYGRPSFVDVLQQVSAAFRDNADAIRHNVAALTPVFDAAMAKLAAPPDDIQPSTFARKLALAFDPIHGGFPGAPKFPNAPILDFLIRSARPDRPPVILDAMTRTMERICNGGIYDHLGGGFARYSVDERWLAPHFEKMLYDNAQLLDLLAALHQRTGDPLFKSRALQTFDFLSRELALPGGAFAASLDADSEGVEGKFYVWTLHEIETVLGASDAEYFAAQYDVTASGNWSDDHGGPRVNILNRLTSQGSDPVDHDRLTQARAKLMRARDLRIRPALDDKILPDWNGLTIAALAHGAIALEAPSLMDAAIGAFDFILRNMALPEGRLSHSWRDGRVLQAGFAGDYVFMIRAALALHEAAPQPRDYLNWALTWAHALRAGHEDPETGLLFTAASMADDVIVRLAPIADDAVPNPHGHWIMALWELAAHTGDDVWRDRAQHALRACTAAASNNPYAHCSILSAIEQQDSMAEIVVFGESATLRTAALALPFHCRMVVAGAARPALAARPEGSSYAVVCRGQRCSLPATTPEELAAAFHAA